MYMRFDKEWLRDSQYGHRVQWRTTLVLNIAAALLLLACLAYFLIPAIVYALR